MIKNGLIVLLILLAIFLFSDKKLNHTITTTKIDTVINIKTLVKHTRGQNISVRFIDTILLSKIDTQFIIKEYNQVKEYTDTIFKDSNLYVITDTISQNKIIGRSFMAKIQEKTITVTNTITPKPKASVYLGIRADLSNDNSKVEHNINLHIKTRQRGLFSVGYGMSGYSIGYSLKL